MKFRLILLLMLLPIISPAQEKLTVDEIIRWFPEGKYSAMRHVDIENASKSDSYHQFLQGRGGNRERLSLGRKIPGFLSYEWTSVTSMLISDIVVDVDKSHSVSGRMRASFKVDGKNYLADDYGSELIVLRFPMEYQLRKAINNNIHFEKQADKINGQSIYRFKHQAPGSQLFTFYSYITEDNSLLYSVKPELLTKMVMTGTGKEMNVDLSLSFPEARDLIPHLSYKWSFYITKQLVEAILEKARKNNANNEDIAKLEMNLESFYSTCSETVFEVPLKSRSYTFLSTRDKARKMLETRKASRNRLGTSDYDKVVYKNTKLTVNGNMFISTLSQTQEYCDAREKQKKVWKSERDNYKKTMKEKDKLLEQRK